jgi:tetratricopeptide (TPR) repeat protein
VDDPRRRTRSRIALAKAFRGKNLNDLAIKQYEQALKDEGLSVEMQKEIRYEIGSAYEETGEVSKALDNYKRVFEEDIQYRDVGQKIEKLSKKVES